METVLHEAAISGNLDAVQILVSKFPKLVNYTNESGETPLFRAAAFGKTKIVKYLASQQHQVVRTGNGESHLQDIHRQRKDGASILHVAVQGEHFGTALGLLELDKGLANLKYRNGTSLYMLAKIPSVFQRGRKMNIFKKLLYNCLPVSNDHHDEAENIEHMEEAKNEQTNSSGNDSGEISIDLPVDDDHNDEAKNIEHKEEARNEQTNSSGIDNGYLSKEE
ncbi:hypothetical protein QYF36_022073 [Acer negundo]|nr:hypothetical protein QYF36_022073 [Acer negundo]